MRKKIIKRPTKAKPFAKRKTDHLGQAFVALVEKHCKRHQVSEEAKRLLLNLNHPQEGRRVEALNEIARRRESNVAELLLPLLDKAKTRDEEVALVKTLVALGNRQALLQMTKSVLNSKYRPYKVDIFNVIIENNIIDKSLVKPLSEAWRDSIEKGFDNQYNTHQAITFLALNLAKGISADALKRLKLANSFFRAGGLTEPQTAALTLSLAAHPKKFNKMPTSLADKNQRRSIDYLTNLREGARSRTPIEIAEIMGLLPKEKEK